MPTGEHRYAVLRDAVNLTVAHIRFCRKHANRLSALTRVKAFAMLRQFVITGRAPPCSK